MYIHSITMWCSISLTYSFTMMHNKLYICRNISVIMEEKAFKEPKEVKKETKKCLCSKKIGRNVRCPDHGDVDKI